MIITASEAKTRTDQVRKHAMEEKLYPIMQKIEDAIINGKYYVDIYDYDSDLDDEAISFLREFGYEITVNVNNTCYDRISWKNNF